MRFEVLRIIFFFSSRRRHTRCSRDWSSDVCSSDLVWIVDPLDGTTNFLHGYPQYGVSIGCLVDGKLAAGVIHDVCRNRTYRAGRGGGAFEEDIRLSVSAATDPPRALLGTGVPFKSLQGLHVYLAQVAAVVGAAGR